jgi:hypothetical protein
MWKKIIIASGCRAGLSFSMASRGSGERHARPDPGGGLRTDGFWLVGLSALLTASCAEVARPSVTSSTGSNASIAAAAGPAQNPFLLASYNNQSHWNDAATDSTDLAVPRGHYRVTPNSYVLTPSDSLGIPAYRADVDGAAVHWFFSGASLRKLHWESGRFVEIDRRAIRQHLENFCTLTDGERRQQAEAVRAFLERGDEEGLLAYLRSQPNRLLSAVEDQVAQGVLYSLMTADHAFIGASARGLVRIDQEDPTDPYSCLAQPPQTTLPDALFDDEKVRRSTIFQSDSVFGLGMTFNGFLVVNTVGGRIISLDRRTFRVIDVFAPTDPAELFTNSFATSEEASGGAVYVASNRKMYRLVIDLNG